MGNRKFFTFNPVRDLIGLGILLVAIAQIVYGFAFLNVPGIALFWLGVGIWIFRKTRKNKANKEDDGKQP